MSGTVKPVVPPVLLIVEDDEGLSRQLRWAYEDYRVVVASDRASAIAALREHAPAVVTLDLGLPPDPDGTSEGFATLAEILRIAPATKVIVASGHGAHDSALRSVGEGAWDFYRKPIDIDTLGLIVARAFHVHALEAEVARLAAQAPAGAGVGGTITAAPEMLKVTRTIERVAGADVSVMLLGPSGAGKELLARGLHDLSPRKRGQFVAINCAAIPETLLESELFGHEKGAFTGAIKTTPGKIEQAHKGTLFLDEIGDVPLPLQVKLLRFIQERVVERVGGRASIAVDTRIVCATHRDIDAMVADGSFREDLYYRLAEIVVRIPALKDRSGDAVLLARHFATRYAHLNARVKGLADDAVAAIATWHWPGNVRELENRIKRATIMADGKRIGAADLDLAPVADDGVVATLKEVRDAADIAATRRALSLAQGNVSQAAKLLGISRPTLYDLIKTHAL